MKILITYRAFLRMLPERVFEYTRIFGQNYFETLQGKINILKMEINDEVVGDDVNAFLEDLEEKR